MSVATATVAVVLLLLFVSVHIEADDTVQKQANQELSGSVGIDARTISKLRARRRWVRHGNVCYLFSTKITTHHKAKHICRRFGRRKWRGRLATITTRRQNNFIKHFIKRNRPRSKGFWIAQPKRRKPGFADWFKGKKRRKNGCVVLKNFFRKEYWRWLKISCRARRHFICQRPCKKRRPRPPIPRPRPKPWPPLIKPW